MLVKLVVKGEPGSAGLIFAERCEQGNARRNASGDTGRPASFSAADGEHGDAGAVDGAGTGR